MSSWRVQFNLWQEVSRKTKAQRARPLPSVSGRCPVSEGLGAVCGAQWGRNGPPRADPPKTDSAPTREERSHGAVPRWTGHPGRGTRSLFGGVGQATSDHRTRRSWQPCESVVPAGVTHYLSSPGAGRTTPTLFNITPSLLGRPGPPPPFLTTPELCPSFFFLGVSPGKLLQAPPTRSPQDRGPMESGDKELNPADSRRVSHFLTVPHIFPLDGPEAKDQAPGSEWPGKQSTICLGTAKIAPRIIFT